MKRSAISLLVLLAAALAAAPASAQIVGGLGFNVGFAGTGEAEFDDGPSADGDLTTTFGITPQVDYMLAKAFGVGGEFGFLWAGGEDAKGDALDRRLILNPALRARMSFPIVKNVTFDGFLAIGPSIWLEQDDVPEAAGGGTRIGWGLRFGFGGSYVFNESVAAFANLGYQYAQSYGEDLTLTYSTIPLNVGLRSQF